MKNKKRIHAALILLISFAIVAGIITILHYTSPRYKLEEYLSQKDYKSVILDCVNIRGNIYTPEILSITYEVKDYEYLLEESFIIKDVIENNLKKYSNNFSNTEINVFFNDSSRSIPIVFKNISTNDYYRLQYGFFETLDCGLTDFRKSKEFKTLYIVNFKDYSDVSALDSMSSLEYLNLYNSRENINADIDYLIEKHPDCTIICNGETVYEPTKVSE